MDKRVAVLAIIVSNRESSDTINELLHENGEYIIGRMGLPYKEKELNIITVVMDAPQDVINTLAGKIGRVPNAEAKTIFAPEA